MSIAASRDGLSSSENEDSVGLPPSGAVVLCSVTHFCVVFEVCVWIIVWLEDPNMAHNKISNRVSHLLIFLSVGI